MKKIKVNCIIVMLLVTGAMLFAQAPDTAWTRKYNGPANNDDAGADCAVSSTGSLYVSGFSFNGTNYDCLIIRYNTVTGDTLWTRRYNGPVNGNDGCIRCAPDNSGNLYVGGWTSNGSNEDFLIIKYNAVTGDTIWTKRIGAGSGNDAASSCAVSGSSYLYVTGQSNNGTNYDYLTFRLNPASGDTIWSRRFSGPAGGDEDAMDCVTDGSGNLYVTGYSYGGLGYNLLTIKYTASGDTVWTRRSSQYSDDLSQVMAGCAMDGSGNVYVTGMCGLLSGNRYCVTIKYSPSGAVQWTKIYDGSTSYDASMGCALDNTGAYLYVTGTSYQGPHDHYFTIKYNAVTGDSIWVKTFLSSISRTEYSSGCAVDGSGYLYITGTSYDTLTWIGDYLTVKYNTGTGVEEAFGRGMNSAVAITAVPNPFTEYTRIPGYEGETFILMDVSGRKIGTANGDRIGNDLPRGVFFALPKNKELKAIRLVKVY